MARLSSKVKQVWELGDNKYIFRKVLKEQDETAQCKGIGRHSSAVGGRVNKTLLEAKPAESCQNIIHPELRHTLFRRGGGESIVDVKLKTEAIVYRSLKVELKNEAE